MIASLSLAGLVTVAAATPGPNNLIVMNSAANRGLVRTLPAMAGIVLGTLGLLVGIIAGPGQAFAALPSVRLAVVITGCLYLAGLGLRLAAPGIGRRDAPTKTGGQALPAGLAGLFVFQLVNPKGWIVLLTAVAAAGARADAPIPTVGLIVLVALVSTVCLLLWSSLGLAMRQLLARPRMRKWFARLMGAVLLACALLLLIEG